jgi:hypothetical protein
MNTEHVATPRKPLPNETTRFTIYGWPKNQRVRPGWRGIPLGHRPTLAEARELVKLRRREGYYTARVVERERDYPYTHIREFSASDS